MSESPAVLTDDASASTTASNPQFTLYSHVTGPNGFKVAEVLGELGLTYRTVMLEFGDGPNGMKTPAYEALNPNGRIPTLVDHGNGDLVVWESVACILYLLKKYDSSSNSRLWAATVEEQAQIETWLLFQASGQGPYIGQAMWFTHYHVEQLLSAKERYVAESRRVLDVVERQLNREGSGGWLVLGRITAADISFLHWWLHAHRVGISIEDEFPVVWAWMQRMKSRPGVKAAMAGALVPAGGPVQGK